MAANDMGLAGGAGGSMAYQLLKDLLARRFTEEQAALKQQNAEAGLDVQRRHLDLGNRQLAESTREYDTTDARDKSQFAEGAPLRAATTANMNENVSSSQWTRSDTKRAADRSDKLAEIRATGDQQVRAVMARPKTDSYRLVERPSPDGKGTVTYRVDLNTNQAMPVTDDAGKALPAKGGALSAKERGEVNQYNAVIRESTRILGLLKQSGLDKDNGMLSARGRSFIANALKVSTDDPVVDALMQNVGYLQTAALRSAAGPTRLTDKLVEIFKPHIASTDMSGRRMAEVLPELLRQVGAVRSDTYKTANAVDPDAVDTSSSAGGEFDWVPGKGLVPRGK